jgi:uncharacterized protein YbjT (DUF2867 family)
MKKALIFGGNGFLGSFVVRELCKKNFEVLIVARSKKNFDTLKTFGFPGQIVFKEFDVSNLNYLNIFDFNPFDVIINLIGIGAECGKYKYHDIHTDFPSRLAGMARKAEKPFVHISAFTGDEEINSKYANTKRKGEAEVMKCNPKAIILRPTTMIGEGGSLIQTFETIINTFPVVPLINFGKTKIQPVFAGDVAKFMVEAIDRSDMQGKTYNLAGSEVILFKNFLERICGFMNKKRILLPVPFFVMSAVLKIKRFLPSFVFRTSLTSDLLELSKYNLIIKENHLKLLIPQITKLDDVLESVLSKYKLYD